MTDKFKINELVIVDRGAYGYDNFIIGKVIKITEKRKDITVEYDGIKNVFTCSGTEKNVNGVWTKRSSILKCTAENMVKYNKYKKKIKVMRFIKTFDGEDADLIDKIYEIIKEE